MYSYGVIFRFLIICLIAWFIGGIFASIYKHIMYKRLQCIVDEIDYYAERNDFLMYMFCTNQSIQKLNVLSAIVSNFSGIKRFDYLVKYFGMKVDDNAMIYLEDFRDIVEELIGRACDLNIPCSYVNVLLPQFSMVYDSPAGRSHRESNFVLNVANLDSLIIKMKSVYGQQNHIKMQRKKMTAALRKQVLERDDYTCCNCGLSIYEEPNLLLEVDHIIPVSRGGKTELDNLQTLCWKCNRQKSSKL